MTPRIRRPRAALVAALLSAALVGAGAGAGIYAAAGATKTTTTTAAAQVPAQGRPAARTTSAQLSVSEIYKQDGDGVVEITATSESTGASPFPFGGGLSVQQAEGSGFVYDSKGDIVTNEHVVDGAHSVSVTFPDGAVYTATVVGSDATTDLAVIKVDAPASELHPLSLADSSKVEVGDGVVAIGSPFGLEGSVASGIVSALHREITSPNNSPIEDAIQTDAAINKGNSGGPLLDLRGDVIGVNSQIESDSGGSDGVGFAIPSSTVRSVVTQLLATGKAKHAFLGIDAQTIPSRVAAELGIAAGVEVSSVQSGSAADRAGLKAATGNKTVNGTSYPTGGDVIAAIDGTKMSSAQQLKSVISAKRPGDEVELTLVRAGKTETVKVTLGERSS